MAPTPERGLLLALLLSALWPQSIAALVSAPSLALHALLFEALARGTDAQYSLYPAPIVAGGGASSIALGNANGVGSNALFSNVYGVAVEASGVVYAVDYGNHKVRMVSPNGTTVTLVGGGSNGNTPANSSNPISRTPTSLADATGTNAYFFQPYGIAIDSSRTLFVSEIGYDRIRKVTPSGLVSLFVGGNATGMVSGSTNGVGTNALFNNIYGLSCDKFGNLYAVESGNHKIRFITPNGTTSTVAGGGATGTLNGFVDGVGTNALFNGPKGVAVGPTGSVFVADSNNFKIRSVTPGGVVSTLAGTVSGFVNGIGGAVRFGTIFALAVDGVGRVFAVDGNHALRVVQPDGTTSSIPLFRAAGNSLNTPQSIAVSSTATAATYVIIANSAHSNIRNVSFLSPPTLCPSGQLCTSTNSTCAGSTFSGPGQFVCCPAGSLANALAGFPSTCAPCGQGFTSDTSSPSNMRCVACAPGTFQNLTVGAACTACPAGAYSDAGAAACVYTRTTCPAATYASPPRSCLPCPGGSFCPTGSPAPSPCQPGTFCPPGSATPVPCAPNSFAGAPGAASCTPCPANGTTLYAGAASASACAPAPAALTAPAAPCAAPLLLNASVPLSPSIVLPGVPGAAPLLFLPSASPLNPGGVDLVVASAAACAALAAQAGSPGCALSQPFVFGGAQYYNLGPASALGMTAATQCGL